MTTGIAIFVDGSFDAELSQASALTVHERAGQPTRYAIRLPLVASENDVPLTADARIGPGRILSLRYQENDEAKVLVEGPVTGQALHFEHGGGDSHLEVQGADASIALDREFKSRIWADLGDADVVSSIATEYGMTPDVESTAAVHATDKHALVQRDTDLRFVQRLARRNGFLFWVTHDGSGQATAHFRPPPLDAMAPGTISLRTPPSTHAVDLSFDTERPTQIEGLQLDLNTKTVIDASSAISPLPNLGMVDLRTIQGDVRSMHVTAPVDDQGDLNARGASALIESGWFIRAETETNRAAFGGVLRAPSVVSIEGIGRRHSGTYFVMAVRHLIDSTVHRMVAELGRNGWGL